MSVCVQCDYEVDREELCECGCGSCIDCGCAAEGDMSEVEDDE